MSITIYVPVRLNSERLPRKLLLDFNGKTLLGIILEKLSKTKYKNDFFLNTDSDEVIDYAKKFACKIFVRSPELTKSTTTTEEILLDFVSLMDCSTEYVAVINPTNPFLEADTIDFFIAEALKNKYDTAFSTNSIKKHCLMDSIPVNYTPFGPHPRTQDVKELRLLNWAIVLWRTSLVKERIKKRGDSIYLGKVGFIDIPEKEIMDIDTIVDFELAKEIDKIRNKT